MACGWANKRRAELPTKRVAQRLQPKGLRTPQVSLLQNSDVASLWEPPPIARNGVSLGSHGVTGSTCHSKWSFQ